MLRWRKKTECFLIFKYLILICENAGFNKVLAGGNQVYLIK